MFVVLMFTQTHNESDRFNIWFKDFVEPVHPGCHHHHHHHQHYYYYYCFKYFPLLVLPAGEDQVFN